MTLQVFLILSAAAFVGAPAASDSDDVPRIRRALGYLEARQTAWAQFAPSLRGHGADQTSCLSCHTGLNDALARPTLQAYADKPGPAESQAGRLATVSLRVKNWDALDGKQFGLMYDSSPTKKAEARGTEAVFNTLILARHDRTEKKTEPSSLTKTAFEHLWTTQIKVGPDAGSWNWLNFGLEPWEGSGSRVFGASLAAVAIGSMPGFSETTLDETAKQGVQSLRDYLRKNFADETLFHRLWILEASTSLDNLLKPDEKQAVIAEAFALQRGDGGWALAPLGDFERVDGTRQAEESDGYATGFVLHVLHHAKTPSSHPALGKGLGWLRSHQQVDGSWPGRSVNKERDPKSFIGKFMTDAATATAALALVELGRK